MLDLAPKANLIQHFEFRTFKKKNCIFPFNSFIFHPLPNSTHRLYSWVSSATVQQFQTAPSSLTILLQLCETTMWPTLNGPSSRQFRKSFAMIFGDSTLQTQRAINLTVLWSSWHSTLSTGCSRAAILVCHPSWNGIIWCCTVSFAVCCSRCGSICFDGWRKGSCFWGHCCLQCIRFIRRRFLVSLEELN